MNKIWGAVFAQVNLKDATIKIKSGNAQEITVVIGEGNLSYTEARTIEYTLDRGQISSTSEVREGDDVPVEVSLDATWKYVTTKSTGSTPTIEDALKQVGGAVDWVSSDPDTCRPYAVDLEITYAPSPTTCGDKETITLPDFRWESIDHDIDAGTLSISGKSNAKLATVVRVAQ